MNQTATALMAFTTRYCAAWQHQTGDFPASTELYGVDSPCIQREDGQRVFWRPQPLNFSASLDAVSKGIGLTLQPSVCDFYSAQLAGDMAADWQGCQLLLLQIWSEQDFRRVQENLIGHLVMKRRLKQTPTLFIGTTADESQIISVDNLTGNVILERLGKKQTEILSPSLPVFLTEAEPRVPA